MNDIFVSYDDEDRERVRRLVEAFEARGWSVWWDHRLAAGDAFAQVIERELRAASCVVVAWTTHSVQSQWVRAEADEARKRGTLLPVRLDPVDLPMPFGQIQTVDLIDWRDEADPRFARLVADLRDRIGKAPLHAKPNHPTRAGRSAALVGITAVITLVVAVLGWYLLAPSPDVRPPGDGVASSTPPDPDAVTTPTPAPPASRDESRVAPPAPGVSGRTVATPSVAAGHWQAKVSYPDGASFEERFTFEVAGKVVTGTASFRGYGNRRSIQGGTIDGNRLSFRTRGRAQTSLFGGEDVTLLYNGTLERDAIRFTLEDDGEPAQVFTARRISAEEAARIATGGTRPRLSGGDLKGLYRYDSVRMLVASRQSELDACYLMAEFDRVAHEQVVARLTVTAEGVPERFEMRPSVSLLESCLQTMLFAIEWGPTLTGAGGTMQLSFTARLPWNR